MNAGTKEDAQILALKALQWLIAEDDLRDVFLGASGATAEDLRTQASDPAFLGSVLDFLLMDDAWVTRFCDENSVDYTRPMLARQMLPGGDLPHWT